MYDVAPELTVTPEATLDVIIVTYQSAQHIDACLRTLYEYSPLGFLTNVFVIDNASTDLTIEIIRRNYPQVQLTPTGQNLGFSKAVNIGLRASRAKYVLVLNPDTELSNGVLDGLISVLQSKPSIGMVGCRLERDDGKFDHASKRNLPTITNSGRYFIEKLKRRGPKRSSYLAPELDEHSTGLVGAINGAFMLARREAIDVVGFFDEAYWMYAEDLDWCKRFSDAGWGVLYDGTYSILHHKAGSSGRWRTTRVNWHFHRSMLTYYAKHADGKPRLLYILIAPAVYCRFIVSAGASFVMRAANRIRRIRVYKRISDQSGAV